MKFSLQFQYKPEDLARPLDYAQTENVNFGVGTPFAIPNVGDTVILTLEEHNMYKVLTRNFAYFDGDPKGQPICLINIVVGDVGQSEKLARLKE